MSTATKIHLDIAKKSHRAKLAPRREPHWKRVGLGNYLGVRISKDRKESWIARHRDSEGKQHYQALDGVTDYDQADAAARTWFSGCSKGVIRAETVEEGCKAYVEKIKIEKGEDQAREAEGRLRRRVYGTEFGRKRIDSLIPADVEAWRDGLLGHEGKPAANRDLSALKAALNRAFYSGLVLSDRAWKAVRPFPNATQARTRFVNLKERQALLQHAQGAIRNLIEAVCHTAARPIEIHRATVADFDPFTRTLTLVGYKGKSGEARRRAVPLTPVALAFFGRMARGKTPAAPLVPRDDGKAWQHSDHDELFRAARDAAGLPENVTLYNVRHSIIAEWLTAGLDVPTVSKIAGTGLTMIERHYAKFIKARAEEKIALVTVL